LGRCSTTRRFSAALLVCALVWGGQPPARAARPLLDSHQWDAYFALFARDVSVPWKPATVRLDTYSGAPVDFAAYNVDPADVIVAGQNRAARALDTAHRKPLVRWRYSPPPGYRFESNDVTVPLGSQEGFYVIEARRGDAAQQVWLNRTHIGLLTEESPEGLTLWGVDLRSGQAIADMDVSFLVGLRLILKRTDRNGLVMWRDRTRPTFALAEFGAGRAFVSLLPQAPPPQAIVGLRVDSAAVRAGERVRFVGFARRRVLGVYHRGSGDARVTLVGRGGALAGTTAHLDAAGAFEGEVTVPPALEAGDYTLLASVAGGVAGSTVHVDAVGDVALALHAACPCDPDRSVPVTLTAKRGELPAPEVAVHVEIVRTPHVVPPGAPEDAPRWGTTVVYDHSLRTDADGRAVIAIPAPSDELDSTYGIRASTRGATATTRVVVPNAPLALALEPDALSADVDAPIAFEVRGFDPLDGAPAADLSVKVRLSHGVSAQEQTVTLDDHGSAHVAFRSPYLGSNLALAEAVIGGRRALDAAEVSVEPSALSGQVSSGESNVSIALDKPRYRPGDKIGARAQASGAGGDALLSLVGARPYQAHLANVAHGEASASLDLGDAQGEVAVTAAFVRNGAIALATVPVRVDGPGRDRATEIALDKPSYDAADPMRVDIRDGGARGGTVALRIADARESGAALFDDAPAVLAAGATSSQNPASDNPQWHAYVVPARSKASDIFAAESPRKVPTEAPSIVAAAPRLMLWKVVRAEGDSLVVNAPKERGHYLLSVLKISDDGAIGAASASFNVQ
jgi:hypothetical protein